MESIFLGVIGVLLIADCIILLVYYRQMRKLENLSEERIQAYKNLIAEYRSFADNQSKEYQIFLKKLLEKQNNQSKDKGTKGGSENE